MASHDNSVSGRYGFTTRTAQSPVGPEDVIGTPALFLLGVVFGTLIVIAVVTNGPGAGTGHHHFVRHLLAGMFVLGGGLIGLVVTTAACGRLGLYDADEPASGAGVNVAKSDASLKMDARLDRQSEHFVRRLHNTTSPAPAALASARPAPPTHVSREMVADASTSSEQSIEADPGHSLNQPHGMHFRRRRPRRA